MNHIEQKKNIKRILSHHTTIAIVIGSAFPLTAIIIDIMALKKGVSLLVLKSLHTSHPSYFLLYCIPVIFGVIMYQITLYRQKEKEKYRDQLRQKEKEITKNAEFAQQIGEGNYEAQLEIYNDKDTLGKALLRMRDNLRENHKKEAEENWISEGKELISNILRIYNKLDELGYNVLYNLIKYIKVLQGAIYIYEPEEKTLKNLSTYAYNRRKYIKQEFKIGQGLIGQCAYEMDYIYRTEIPDDYVTITSGILGDQKPSHLLLVPLIADEKLQGVLEFASVHEITRTVIHFLQEMAEIIARTLFNLRVNLRTEKLLTEAQEMTRVLKENEEQLRQNAEEMRATQEELERSNEQLAAQIKAVENAQKRLNSLLENASEIILIYDKNLRISFVSPSVIKILGFSQEEIMRGKDIERLTRKGEMEFRNMLNMLIEHPEEPITIQYTYIKKDGKKIFLETTGRNLLHDPALHGIIINSQDITERKRAEKEERMRSRMQSLSENSLDMIIRLNTMEQFFYANPVVEDYFGRKPDEIINKRVKEVNMPAAFSDYFSKTIENIKATPKKQNAQITIPIQIGKVTSERIMSIDAIPEFADNETELETILFVGHDISEAKRIEREIQEKNKKIEDSINYAQRIQTAILPNNKLIREIFPKSFIYYQPRDIVSGDFPWMFVKNDNIYIAAVDCTGHGVPGALLSFIGYFTLNNVADHDNNFTAAQILDEVHQRVRTTLNQDRPDATARDGMDIAFCKINLKNRELQYAGAHRPLYFIRNDDFKEYKGNRKAIGGIPHAKIPEKPFFNYKIKFRDGDRIFFFSDGITDQIGGPENKKYSSQRIREIIIKNYKFTMPQLNAAFIKDLKEWTGNNKQIDDVLLIGIEF